MTATPAAGTSPELAQAYTGLLERPNGDLADFARRLGLDEAAARALLDRLAALSLVEERERELVALSPLLAMQQLLYRERGLLEQRQEFLRDSYQTLTQLMSSYVDARFTGAGPRLFEEITDLASVRRRIEELAVGARWELLSFTPAAREPRAARAAAHVLDRGLLDRGVSMRTIYPDSVVDDRGAYDYARQLAAGGGSVRLCPELPTRLLVVDQLVAVVPHDPADGSRGCVVVSHPGTVAALVSLFTAYWRAGRPLAKVRDERTCTSLERSVLRALLAGAKDDAVARQMGVSVRTIRRCIADLMARLGASSRFELGAGATRRGWI
jgi:DNA-binding CsgD family transcriptional regulator